MSGYKRYPAYKESGVEWIGEIPAGWDVCKVGLFSELINGFPFKSELFNSETGTPLIRIRDITDGSTETYFNGDFDDEYLIENDDILVGMDGDFLARWWQGGQALLNQRCCCLRPLPSVSKRFFYNFLQFPLDLINDLTYYTTVKHLSSGQIRDIRFPYPDIGEQTKIAAFLDRKTAQIDRLIEIKRRQIAVLKEERTAVINHAVTKGLNSDAKMKESGIQWIGEIPEEWQVKRLKHISPSQSVGLVINPSSYFTDEGVPFLLGGNISEGSISIEKVRTISEESNEQLRQSMLYHGDLVVVRVGYPGVTAVIPPELDRCNCGSMMIVRKAESFNSQWLCYLFNSQVGKSQIDIVKYGAAQQQFNIGHAVEFWFPYPPKNEQDALASFLDVRTAEISSAIDKAEQQIQLLQEYRTTLISDAVTGKIDVREEAA